MTWMNGDGLFVKFGKEEGADARGGEVAGSEGHVIEFTISYLDLLSATTAVLGSVAVPAGSATGSLGVVVPEGAVVEEIEFWTTTAFTSSGTIGSSTLVMGTKKLSDRSTELDHDGFTTTSFVAGVLDAVGEKTVLRVGGTGAGAHLGVALSENGVITVANSAHATHPYTAGVVRVKIRYSLA